MIIYYKKETNLTKYIHSKEKVTIFKEPGFLHTIGFKTIIYPDIYFHTGTINSFSKTLIENSKITIVNSTILKNKLIEDLTVKEDNIEVIYPAVDVEPFKKKEIKKPFYEKYNIPNDYKIIYFTGKNLKKSGLESFCKIINNLEMDNFKAVISTNIEKELKYLKDVLKQNNLEDKVLIVDYEIFDVADIFVLPTTFKNFSINVVKAMANKCITFVPESNYSVELVDIFSIMRNPNDPNTSYKIDMVLRVKDELKKIQKENYKIGKKLTLQYQHRRLDRIIEKLKTK